MWLGFGFSLNKLQQTASACYVKFFPENERITYGLLEVLQFEKSYDGKETTFFLKWGKRFHVSSHLDLFMVLSKLLQGFGSQWTSNIITSVNQKLV